MWEKGFGTARLGYDSLKQLCDLSGDRTELDILHLMDRQAAQKKRAQEIVSVAEKMLADDVGLIEGSRQLLKIASDGPFYYEDAFLIFRGIDSESDIFPPEGSRQYWDSDTLERLDKEASEYEARVRDSLFQACRELIRKIETESTSRE